MFRVSQRRKRYYGGQIVLGNQPISWIKEHRSFASKEWFEGQVRYGEWIRESRDHFLIYAIVPERIKHITVLIKIQCFSTHVLVYHAHVLRRK